MEVVELSVETVLVIIGASFGVGGVGGALAAKALIDKAVNNVSARMKGLKDRSDIIHAEMTRAVRDLRMQGDVTLLTSYHGLSKEKQEEFKRNHPKLYREVVKAEERRNGTSDAQT